MSQLTVVERGSLRKLEAVIERGMATFVEVGNALKTIRDENLYKESHKTFEKYVSERWGMQKSRAYQLIDAAEIKQEISTMVDVPRIAEIVNERQIRELADVPTEDIPLVMEAAAEIAGDEPITAKVLHKAVEQVISEDQEERDSPKPEKPTKPVEMSKAEQAVFNASVMKEIYKTLSAALKATKDIKQIPGTELFLARQRSIEREILSARDAVQVTIPHSVCPRCKGKGCPQCGNHGWVNAVMAKELENVK